MVDEAKGEVLMATQGAALMSFSQFADDHLEGLDSEPCPPTTPSARFPAMPPADCWTQPDSRPTEGAYVAGEIVALRPGEYAAAVWEEEPLSHADHAAAIVRAEWLFQTLKQSALDERRRAIAVHEMRLNRADEARAVLETAISGMRRVAVNVVVLRDDTTSEMVTVRADSGVEIDRRPMTIAESTIRCEPSTGVRLKVSR